MLSVIILRANVLSAVMLDVVAPIFPPKFRENISLDSKMEKTQKIKRTVATFAIARLNISVKAIK